MLAAGDRHNRNGESLLTRGRTLDAVDAFRQAAAAWIAAERAANEDAAARAAAARTAAEPPTAPPVTGAPGNPAAAGAQVNTPTRLPDPPQNLPLTTPGSTVTTVPPPTNPLPRPPA